MSGPRAAPLAADAIEELRATFGARY